MSKPAKQEKFKAVPGCKCGTCQQILKSEQLEQMVKSVAALAGMRKPDMYFGKAAS